MVDFDFIHKDRITLQGTSRPWRKSKFHFMKSPPNIILVIRLIWHETKVIAGTTSHQSLAEYLTENCFHMVKLLHYKRFQILWHLIETPKTFDSELDADLVE